jgi:hypothetical protein
VKGLLATSDTTRRCFSRLLGFLTTLRGRVSESASVSVSTQDLTSLIRQGLSARLNPRDIVADPQARYFGGIASERTLVPGDGA